MFGDLMGQMQDMQGKMREKLRAITVEAEAGDGVVTVVVNAAREVLNVRFDRERLDWDDTEAVEDLLVVALNRALAAAAEKEAAEGQSALRDMLPPGLGNLFGR
jgi:hypothetical protein